MAGATRKPNSVPGPGYPEPGNDHSSRMPVARHLLRPTRKLGRTALKRFPIWSCTGWGLPSFPGHPGNWCALTAPFHPYPAAAGRYIFCCTFLRVATTSRYEAPCPAVFGLSSGSDAIRRSFGLLRPFILILPVNDSKTTGTIAQAVAALEFIVNLGWNIHIASLTNRILNRSNGHQIFLFGFHLVKDF